MVQWNQVENALEERDVAGVEAHLGYGEINEVPAAEFYRDVEDVTAALDGKTPLAVPDSSYGDAVENNIADAIEDGSSTTADFNSMVINEGYESDGEVDYEAITIGDLRDPSYMGFNLDDVAWPLLPAEEVAEEGHNQYRDANMDAHSRTRRDLLKVAAVGVAGVGIGSVALGHSLTDGDRKAGDTGGNGTGRTTASPTDKSPTNTQTPTETDTGTPTDIGYPTLHYKDPALREIQQEHQNYFGQLEEIIALKGDLVTIEYNEETDEIVAKTSPNEYTSISGDTYDLLREEK